MIAPVKFGPYTGGKTKIYANYAKAKRALNRYIKRFPQSYLFQLA